MVSDFRNLVFAQKTDRGLRRGLNEDACDVRIPKRGTPADALGALFLVADGIGGMGGGEHASHAAIETILSTYYDSELEDDHPRERLIAAIQDANEAVRARARTLNVQALGTTVAGALILPNAKSYLFSVGDSRIYLLNGGAIQQMTLDQSSLDMADAKNSYARAKLTAFIGQLQPIVPQLIEYELRKDDTLLICSDGLWGLVDPDEIAVVVSSNPPEKAVDRLIKMVYERGARDNITITIIQAGKRASYALVVFAVFLIALIIGVVTFVPPLLMPDAGAQTAPATASFTPSLRDGGVVDSGENHGQLVIRTPTPQVKIDKRVE